MSEELFHYLQPYFAGRYAGATLSDFAFVISGWESDVYSFVLHRPDVAPQSLILRLYPDSTAIPKMVQEANGLRLLRQAGYPVPALFLSETESSYLDKPFTVMEKLEGQALWPALAAATSSEVDSLLDRFGSLLAQLHQLDWHPFVENAARYEAEPTLFLDEAFASLRHVYTRFDVTGFLPLVDWLETHRTEVTVRPAVVHLDFHANNVFLCHDGHLAVIDWTQVTVADHRADLTWTLMLMGDYGHPQWGERILQAYHRARNETVENLDYFQVITYLKILASTVISLKSSPQALGLRPETARSIAPQVPILRKLAQRVQDITGFTVPEIETALEPFP